MSGQWWNPLSWGDHYDAQVAKDHQAWWSAHEELPILAIGFYLCIVFKGPKFIERFPPGPMQKNLLKYMWFLWNLGLSAFSWFGLINTVPRFLDILVSHGYYKSICTDPWEWYTNGKVAFWLEMFILSKFPELLDTVFLVLQGKRVIFLHWYHHITVLLFCWQAYIRDAGPGLWYCAMNYSVHAVMYLYYAGMAVPALRKYVSKMGLFITTAQILQMFMGAAVTMNAAWWWVRGFGCHLEGSTCALGVVMYLSYLGLFVSLFVDKYCTRRKPCVQKSSMGEEPSMGSMGEEPSMGEVSSDLA